MGYAGGKGRIYQRLLNMMPPHTTYVETHLGGGAVMRNKRPAVRQIGIEIDPVVFKRWSEAKKTPCELICGDAVAWLEQSDLELSALIYADPPYVRATRRRCRVYRYDYTDVDHIRLLECLKRQKCMVMVSGYRNDIYDEMLNGWQRASFMAMTHAGMREEFVWFNFNPPQQLHDARHLGDGYRQREIIKRRMARLRRRVSDLSRIEQFYLLEWLRAELGGIA
ncbi:DNA adenine methylase [Desulfovibrio aminophilus]|nr:DNA adenine methylase [Desulfovibrio aminophilus]MCM0754811.1 DNA adenine methylase [Desulfovibrio aminophilus]